MPALHDELSENPPMSQRVYGDARLVIRRASALLHEARSRTLRGAVDDAGGRKSDVSTPASVPEAAGRESPSSGSLERTRLVIVYGGPGSGKTRIGRAIMARVACSGAHVLYLPCNPADSALCSVLSGIETFLLRQISRLPLSVASRFGSVVRGNAPGAALDFLATAMPGVAALLWPTRDGDTRGRGPDSSANDSLQRVHRFELLLRTLRVTLVAYTAVTGKRVAVFVDGIDRAPVEVTLPDDRFPR